MKVEHIGFNVADPVAMTAWYGKHCGFRIVRQFQGPAHTHFIADTGSTVLEIYHNPPDKVPDYRNMDPLMFHIAIDSADPSADAKKMMSDGATYVSDVRLDDGSFLIMLRDPWGIPLQLARRAKPLL